MNVMVDEKELARLLLIEKAAKNLCDVKGRYHTEQAMKELMKLYAKEAE